MHKVPYECITNKWNHDMVYINQASKICSVIITQHIWAKNLCTNPEISWSFLDLPSEEV